MKYDIIKIDKRPPVGVDIDQWHYYLKERVYLYQNYSYNGDFEVVETKEDRLFITHLVRINRSPIGFPTEHYMDFESDDDAKLWFEVNK